MRIIEISGHGLLMILCYILILQGCHVQTSKEKTMINIDELPKIEYQFNQLPEEVQNAYINNSKPKQLTRSMVEKGQLKNFFNRIIINLDSNKVNMVHNRPSDNAENYVSEIKNPNDYVIIGEKEFFLPYQKGDPFILCDKRLYYTLEYNLWEEYVESATYVEVDLSDYLRY